MKVIVSGAPKTGTKSIAEALTLLGYNVYDFAENHLYLGEEWRKIIKEGATVEQFRKMYENVDAVTDVPCCHFWDQLHAAFPDAKILHSERAEDDWWKSVVKQLNVLPPVTMAIITTLSPTCNDLLKYLSETALSVMGVQSGSSTFKNKKINELACRMWYRRHNEYVKQTAPKDQLLIYSVKEGWGPLCKFLGKGVPNTPFPHKNKDGSIVNERTGVVAKRIEKELIVSSTVLVALTGYLIYDYFTNSFADSLFGLPGTLLQGFVQYMGYQRV